MKLKKLLSLLLVIALIVSLAGCGSKDETSESNGKESTTSDTKKEAGDDTSDSQDDELEPMEISIGYWDASDRFGENDPVLDIIMDKFNVTFEGRGVSWSDYQEKYKLWAASGELPDVFAIDALGSEMYNTWIDQGIVKALPEDLSAYPNIEAIMAQPDVTPLMVDGQYYMIPRLTYPSTDMWRYDRGVVVRKDWLADLGLEVPTTFEAYKEVLHAFVDGDPDGNGVNDTTGVTHKNVNFLQAFFLGSVPQVINNSWIKEDGQWIPAFYSKNMITGVQQLKDLYQEGLLDKDFAIMKTGDGIDKFAQGNVGMLTIQTKPSTLRDIKERWVKYDHDTAFEDAVQIIPAWENIDGTMYSFSETTYWSESYINGDIDDAKMERILMIYDYLKSPEFMEIRTYGIEGVDYSKDGDDYTILLEKDEDGLYPSMTDKYPSMVVFSTLVAWDQQLSLIENEVNKIKYGEEILAMCTDFGDYCEENVTPTPINYDVKLMSTPAKTQLSAVRYMDDIIRIMLSEGDAAAEWEETRESYKQYGLEAAITEVNEKAATMGIE